jgi:hypothetical protein
MLGDGPDIDLKKIVRAGKVIMRRMSFLTGRCCRGNPDRHPAVAGAASAADYISLASAVLRLRSAHPMPAVRRIAERCRRA